MINIEQMELATEIARWIQPMLVQEDPWEWASIEVKRHGDAYDACFEVRDAAGERSFGGEIGPQFSQFNLLHRWQEVSATPDGGSWLAASVLVDPRQVRTTYNFNDEVGPFFTDSPDFTAQDAVDNLTEFPRVADRIPAWLRRRIESAGLTVPVAES